MQQNWSCSVDLYTEYNGCSLLIFLIQDGGKQLQQNLEENKTITHIDLRLTECGTELSTACIRYYIPIERKNVNSPCNPKRK
ncbi:hypothetical protein EB796_004841 [Bugula neritina]|uniref:Uncharacterized protein n=1 Tax=Bugula neritina TaxID=10212 RepID=A0A7J7KF51_BUGNE|nr:hypothetical protein EB796_004841 [Bugula neritina]